MTICFDNYQILHSLASKPEDLVDRKNKVCKLIDELIYEVMFSDFDSGTKIKSIAKLTELSNYFKE